MRVVGGSRREASAEPPAGLLLVVTVCSVCSHRHSLRVCVVLCRARERRLKQEELDRTKKLGSAGKWPCVLPAVCVASSEGGGLAAP